MIIKPTLFLLLIGLSFQSDLRITKNKITLSINRNTTKQEIKNYQSELLKKKIRFYIYNISFTKENKIDQIEIRVDCNDGFKGSIHKKLDAGNSIGFIRDYSTDAESPFYVF